MSFINELSARTPLPGDYYWKQYSMWEVAPEESIKKYVVIKHGGGDFTITYYLVRVTKVTTTINGNSWTTELVKQSEIQDIPEEVLAWREIK